MINSIIRNLYWNSGLNLRKLEIVIRGLPRVWTRPFDHLPLKGIGAEIGVYRGIHAKEILKSHPEVKELWLVDSYSPYLIKDGGNLPHLQEAKKAAHKLLKNERVFWIEESSPGCVHKLPELDFAYIDAGHGYEAIKKDIEALWPKIKTGGIIGGHDFHPNWPGIIQAVCEFSVKVNKQLYAETPDWWIIK